jgi:methyl-accepting chemotaxis protein
MLRWILDAKVRVKLLGGFLAMAVLLMLGTLIGYMNVRVLRDNLATVIDTDVVALSQAQQLHTVLLRARGDVYRYVVMTNQRAEAEAALSSDMAALHKDLGQYGSLSLTQEDRQAFDKVSSSFADYEKAIAGVVSEVKAGNDQAVMDSLQDGGAVISARTVMETNLDALVNLAQARVAASDAQADAAVILATRLTIAGGLLGVVLALGLGLYLSNSITRPLRLLVSVMQRAAKGDLNRNMEDKERDSVRRRGDELGEIGRALTALMAGYLRPMAEAAHSIAGGDLSVQVAPQCEADELGHAFHDMLGYLNEMAGAADRIAQGDLSVVVQPRSQQDAFGMAMAAMAQELRGLIGKVNASAHDLDLASEQLAAAARESGLATQQIAGTTGEAGNAVNQIAGSVQQVAQGTSQQALAVQQTTEQIERLAEATESIATGAQDQDAVMNRSAGALGEMAAGVQRTIRNAEASTHISAQSAETAQAGAETVRRVVDGMGAIQAAVTDAARKVQQMQRHSGQIGEIVKTIENIAEQTNLLALNAAIEAARAGEQGRGFAVVAEEVRKLADQTGRATKEIAQLVQTVQNGTQEAVAAMQASMGEVSQGTNLANQAGSALQQIVSSAQQVTNEVNQIVASIQQIADATVRLQGDMVQVSEVAQRNRQATQDLTDISGEIRSAMESVASVSEETSAMAEEVSATTQEMSAQVEELSASAQEMSAQAEQVEASAQSLREMARMMTELVNAFRLDEASEVVAAPNVATVNRGGYAARPAHAATTSNGRASRQLVRA